jgi:N-methylhydantoinase A
LSSSQTLYSIGVDIGGTFTDCVVVADDGRCFTGKVPTTPSDRSEGFFNAIEDAAISQGMSIGDLLVDTRRLAHGTTVGINALVTRSGARVGLLATKGHGDAIRIMDNTGRVTGASIEEILDYSRSGLPVPFIGTEDIVEITERIDSTGEVVVSLDEDEVSAQVREMVSAGVESIAVSFLWSHLNPDHELEVARVIRSIYPDMFVTCSHQVAPRIGEYPRTVSTIMNAYIGPLMAAYVDSIRSRARSYGYSRDVVFATGSGGLVDANTVIQFPILTAQSGPVSGVLACTAIGPRIGFRNILTTDMGGTSLDACVIENGQAVLQDEAVIERHQLFLRRIDVDSIGAGGGSLARFDEVTGTIKVGPESAGAVPGPACYGRGGTEPTVTDADLVLGMLNPNASLAGGVKLDLDAATRALEKLGDKCGLDAVHTAAGIAQIVDSQMEDLLRRMTVQKGRDPGDLSVWAFGGAAGLHAGVYSRGLGAENLVIPMGDMASVWSAYGIAVSDMSRTFQLPLYLDSPLDHKALSKAFTELERRAKEYAKQVLPEGTEIQLRRSAELKFALQFYSLEIEAPPGDIDAAYAASLVDQFEERYEGRYGAGSGYRAAGVTTSTVSVSVTAPQSLVVSTHPPLVAGSPTSAESERAVFWPEVGEFVDTPILDGSRFSPGGWISGPAIIEYPDTSVAVRPGDRADVDSMGNIMITLAKHGSRISTSQAPEVNVATVGAADGSSGKKASVK